MKRLASLITAFLLLLAGLMPSAFAQQADAMLDLNSSVVQANAGETFTVQVEVKNPGFQDVISVRSWLKYNPSHLEAVDLDTDASPFTLAAPGEDKIEPGESMIKIGRSNIEGGMKQSQAMVATVTFRVKTQSPVNTVISFYDYQVTELGHTSVNIVDQGFPINILSGNPDSLVIPLNGGAPAAGGGDEVGNGDAFAGLARPENLRINTGSGNVELRWDMGKEPHLAGYYVYYGRNSGMYTRRRDVGRVDRAFLEGFQNGDTYYFAITAYDAAGRESDYSNEVGVIIGEPLSSTAPFEDLLNQLLANLPSQPQNGPLAWWLVICAAGMSWMIVFRKKRSLN